MPCKEFTDAINWNKQTTQHELFPVTVYFTKHFGSGATQASTQMRDAVHYASGDVDAVDAPTPHLKGTLSVARNTNQPGQMVSNPALTYDVEISRTARSPTS